MFHFPVHELISLSLFYRSCFFFLYSLLERLPGLLLCFLFLLPLTFCLSRTRRNLLHIHFYNYRQDNSFVNICLALLLMDSSKMSSTLCRWSLLLPSGFSCEHLCLQKSFDRKNQFVYFLLP